MVIEYVVLSVFVPCSVVVGYQRYGGPRCLATSPPEVGG
jgi:hypothetical protein